MIGRSIACFLGPLQHAYWQKGAEGYGVLEERTARVRGLEDCTRCSSQHRTSRRPASGLSWHRHAHESTSDLSQHPGPVQRSICIATGADVSTP